MFRDVLALVLKEGSSDWTNHELLVHHLDPAFDVMIYCTRAVSHIFQPVNIHVRKNGVMPYRPHPTNTTYIMKWRFGLSYLSDVCAASR